MTLRLISLLLLSLLAAPAVTITIDGPSAGSPIENGNPVFINFTIDNSDPGNPDAALWLLITSIELELLGPSLVADFNFTDFVSGLVNGSPLLTPLSVASVLVGPAGSFGVPDVIFLSGVQIEPLLTATAGLNDLRFIFNYDWFLADPYDPLTGDLLPDALADGSVSVTLPTFQLEVIGSAVPEPSTVVAGLGLLMIALRRMRNSTQVR